MTILYLFGKTEPKLAKVSLGAEKTVAWEKCASTGKLIDRLKKDGYEIFAIEQSPKSIPYYKLSAVPTRWDSGVLAQNQWSLEYLFWCGMEIFEEVAYTKTDE